MKPFVSRSLSASLHALGALVVLFSFGLYYYVRMESQKDYLHERNLRRLTVLGDQIKMRIQNLRQILRYTPDQLAAQDNISTVREYLQRAGISITRLKETGGPTPKKYVSKRITGLTQEFNNDTTRLHFTVSNPSGKPWKDLNVAIDMEKVVVSSLVGDVFSNFLIVNPNGKVIFQHEHQGVTIDSLATVTTLGGAVLALRDCRNSSGTYRMEIAGISHEVFIRPMRIDTKTGHGGGGVLDWTLVGLVESRSFNREAMEISYTTLMMICAVIILIVLLWPMVRLWSIGRTAGLKRADVIAIAVSLLFGCSVIAIMTIDLAGYYALQERLDRQTETLADTIHSRANEEVVAALRQLMAYREGRGNQLPDTHRTDILARRLDPIYPRHYAYPERVFWVNSDGIQTKKWSTTKKVTPPFDVSERNYYKNIRDNRLLEWREGKTTFAFAVEPHYSWSTGDFRLALSVPPSGKKSFSQEIPVMIIRPASLMQPILPEGRSFAIIDREGVVLFHSSVSRNLNENFIDECNDPRLIRAIVSGRSTETLSMRYFGRDYRMTVRPMAHLPWTLVVLRDRLVERTLNLQVVAGSMILFSLSALSVIIILVIATISRSWDLGWVWPNPSDTIAYRQLAAIFIVILAFHAALQFSEHHFFHEVLTTMLVPQVGVTLAYLRLNYRVFSKLRRMNWVQKALASLPVLFFPGSLVSNLADGEWHLGTFQHILFIQMLLWVGCILLLSENFKGLLSRWQFPRFRASFTLAVAALFLLIGVHPSLVFFDSMFKNSLTLLVKHGQVAYAHSLTEREEQLRRDKENDRIYRMDDRVRISRNHSNLYLDPLYSNINETSCRESCNTPSEPPNAGDGIENDLLHFLLTPYNLPSIEFREMIHNYSGDSLRKWTKYASDSLMMHSGQLAAGNSPIHLAAAVPSLRALLAALPRGQLSVFGCIVLLLLVVLVVSVRWIMRAIFMIDCVDYVPTWIYHNLSESMHEIQTYKISVVESPLHLRVEQFGLHIHNLPFEEEHIVVVDLVDLPENAKKGRALLFIRELISAGKKVILLIPSKLSDAEMASLSPGGLLDNFPLKRRLYPDHQHDSMRSPDPKHMAMSTGEEITDPESTEVNLVSEMFAREEEYHRAVWERTSSGERFVLLDLAEDGFVNANHVAVVEKLLRRRLIIRAPNFQFVDEGFRRFVRMLPASVVEEVRHPMGVEPPSGRTLVHTSAIVLLLALGAFIFYTQREAFNAVQVFVSAIALLIPGLFKLLGSIQAAKGSGS